MALGATHHSDTLVNQSERDRGIPGVVASRVIKWVNQIWTVFQLLLRILLLYFLFVAIVGPPSPSSFFKRMKNDGPASRTMAKDQVRTRRDPGTARSFIMTPFGGAEDIVLVYYASSCRSHQCHQSQRANGAYERRNANLETGESRVRNPPPDLILMESHKCLSHMQNGSGECHDWLTLCKFSTSGHLNSPKKTLTIAKKQNILLVWPI